MAEAQTAGGGRWKLLAVVTIIVLLLAAIAYLLGQLNQHRFYLVKQGRNLVVHKGASIPFVTDPFVPRTEDERLAYAPIPVPPRSEVPDKQSFSDRGELDRGIYALLHAQLKKELYDGKTPKLGKVDATMERIHALTGLGDAEHESLDTLEGDYAFIKAQAIIEGLPQRLREAARLCETADEQGSGLLGDPKLLARNVNRWMAALNQAGLAQPAPATTTFAGPNLGGSPTPAPQPEALPPAPGLPESAVQPGAIPAPVAPAPPPGTPAAPVAPAPADTL